MKDFTPYNPTKIIFGKTAMTHIAENAKAYGNKVLLTYGGGSIKKNGIYDKVVKQLQGFEVKEFGGIEPNPRVETLQKCLAQHKGFEPDLIVAVGGGSTIDGSKLLSAAWHYDGDPWGLITDKKAEPRCYVPLATIVTLSATGSEMNSAAVISQWETHEKLVLVRGNLYPRFSILDPQNLYSLPQSQTAYGAVDTFSHVLEQYMTTTADAPLQDKFSESILHVVVENAPIALKNPTHYEARANLMLCATMALNDLIGCGVAQDWATHEIEHELSAFYDIPHGAGLAIITPRWMKVVKEQKREKLIQYGRRVWDLTDGNADSAIDKTYNFFKRLGIKMSLREWNIDETHFDTMVERLVKKEIGEIPLSEKQIREILESCLK